MKDRLFIKSSPEKSFPEQQSVSKPKTFTSVRDQKKEKLLEHLNCNPMLSLPDDILLMVFNQLSAHDIEQVALSSVIFHQGNRSISRSLSSALSRLETPRDVRLIRDYWEYETHHWMHEWTQKFVTPALSRRIILAPSSRADDVLSLLNWLGTDKKPAQKVHPLPWEWLFFVLDQLFYAFVFAHYFATKKSLEAHAFRCIHRLKANPLCYAVYLSELEELIPDLSGACCLSLAAQVMSLYFGQEYNRYLMHGTVLKFIGLMAKKMTASELDALLNLYCTTFSEQINASLQQRRGDLASSILSFIQLFTHHLSPMHVDILLEAICAWIIQNKDIEAYKYEIYEYEIKDIRSIIGALLPSLSAEALKKIYDTARKASSPQPVAFSVMIYTELSTRLTLEQNEEVRQYLNGVFNEPDENNIPVCIAGLKYLDATHGSLSKESVATLFQAASSERIDPGLRLMLMIGLVPRLTEGACYRAWDATKHIDGFCEVLKLELAIQLLSRQNTTAFSMGLVYRFLRHAVLNENHRIQRMRLLRVAMNGMTDSELQAHLNNLSYCIRCCDPCDVRIEACKTLDLLIPRLAEQDILPFISSCSKALLSYNSGTYQAVIRTIKNIMNDARYAACRDDWFDKIIGPWLTRLQDHMLAPFALLLCSDDLDVSLKRRLVQRANRLDCSDKIRALIDTAIAIHTDALPKPACHVAGVRGAR